MNVYTRGAATMKDRRRRMAARGEQLGAGEILLTSMDTDGVQRGSIAPDARGSLPTHIPVIARVAPAARRFRPRLQQRSRCQLAASIFHYGTYTSRI